MGFLGREGRGGEGRGEEPGISGAQSSLELLISLDLATGKLYHFQG